MAYLSDRLFEKVKNVAKSVKEELRLKGIVLPHQEPDGTYSFDGICVKKDSTGFYKITDKSGKLIVNNINLPQTAALIANGLALGKLLDTSLLNTDANYGYKLFDYDVYKHAAERNRKKDVDKFIYYDTRCKIANAQRKQYKETILKQFEKLRRLR